MVLLGGQFKSATHGQFKSAQGGQFDRILQAKLSWVFYLLNKATNKEIWYEKWYE